MREFSITCAVLVTAVCTLISGIATGQEGETIPPTMPVADPVMVPLDPVPPPTDPVLPPAEPTAPETVPPWTWQHQTQNQQGTVNNLHERTGGPDGNYSYQHSVTRPNGSHTQLREYSQTEEGYQYMHQHRFYQPDGTLLREHSSSLTGTDPYNYQRQMTHTFGDGRTMEQTFTRSYDGTTGTMERSFVGPNGQVRQFERPWAPDGLAGMETPQTDPATLPGPQEVGLPAAEQLGIVPPTIVDPLAPATTPKADEGFLSWLNPFKKRGANASAGSAGSTATAKRSGFTIGSFGQSRQMGTLPPGQARKASGLSEPSQMRSMKADAKQIGPPPHAAANLPGKAGKAH